MQQHPNNVYQFPQFYINFDKSLTKSNKFAHKRPPHYDTIETSKSDDSSDYHFDLPPVLRSDGQTIYLGIRAFKQSGQ